jgi:hypothetical protein
MPPPAVSAAVGFPSGGGVELAWGTAFVQVTGMPASVDLAAGRRWGRALGHWGTPYVAAAGYAWCTPLLFGGPLATAPGVLGTVGWSWALPGNLSLAAEVGGFLLWVPPGSEGNRGELTPGPRFQLRLGWGRSHRLLGGTAE